MGKVRRFDTEAEIRVRKALHANGYRFRPQRRDLPGTPDIVLPKYRAVIFVNGCFWHQHEGCKKSTTPKTRTSFWEAKLAANVRRDRDNRERLAAMRWRCFEFWECDAMKPDALASRIERFKEALADNEQK